MRLVHFASAPTATTHEDAAVPQPSTTDGEPAVGPIADAAPAPVAVRSSAPIKITRDEARLLAVAAQGLDRRPPARVPRTKDLILATIRDLGCVQLDTISVISRSHETVLWSRLGPFDPSLVWELAYSELGFEPVVHADLGPEHLEAAVAEFHGRRRRFGGLDS